MKTTVAMSADAFPPFVRKHYAWLFHAFLAFTVYTFWIAYVYKSIVDWQSFFRIFSYASTYLAVVYVNVYFLFNRFFLTGRFYTYFASTFALFFTACLLLQRIYTPSWDAYAQSFLQSGFWLEFIILGIKCITFTGLGIAYRLLTLWVDGERRIAALSNANLKAELANLKSQISPHFLFNTLNNLYVLTKTKPNVAAETVLELSTMMRYQLCECTGDRVPLKREMEYIKSLLALEQLRKDKWQIDLKIPELLPETLHIEPLLFITLIENAIKHGSQQLERGVIHVRLDLSPTQLTFKIANTKPPTRDADINSTQIGLNNLKRRLDILYPQRHVLSIQNRKSEFTATLTLEL